MAARSQAVASQAVQLPAVFVPATNVVLLDAGRSLRESFFMLWQTLWALVLGFSLSGAVQTFVSRQEMERVLGNHRPAAVLRATGLGAVSSSCSYAAASMARALVARGADFVSAMVFMVASTNLVVELGIVLVVLVGWPFLAAELAGAPVMIAVLVLGGGLVMRRGTPDDARRRAMSMPATGGHDHHDHHHPGEERAGPAEPWRLRLRRRSSWTEVAHRAYAELYTVRRELLVGFVVAGFLATVVPATGWNAAFVHGHGAWSDLENAAVAPVIAFASCVCSVGNVPLAAALWHGGIAFGAVVTFVFADLLAAPLVLVYRRYYGTGTALRMVALLWMSMVVAGLVVQLIFSRAGLIPATRPVHVVPLAIRLGPTSVLDGLALLALGALWWASRRRIDRGPGDCAHAPHSSPVATGP